MWNQVGSPSMFDGKTFLPLHGMPIWCRARSRTRLADWLPEALTVPTRMARSLIVRTSSSRAVEDSTTGRVGDIRGPRGGGLDSGFVSVLDRRDGPHCAGDPWGDGGRR